MPNGAAHTEVGLRVLKAPVSADAAEGRCRHDGRVRILCWVARLRRRRGTGSPVTVPRPRAGHRRPAAVARRSRRAVGWRRQPVVVREILLAIVIVSQSAVQMSSQSQCTRWRQSSVLKRLVQLTIWHSQDGEVGPSNVIHPAREGERAVEYMHAEMFL